jgi:integrase
VHKKYANSLWLTKLNNISKEIYLVGQRYKQWAMKYKKRQKAMSSRIRLFYFIYLTADRVSENLIEPLPDIRLSSIKGKQIVIANRVNEKHFLDSGERERIPEILFINGIYEKLMWEYIFPDDMVEEQTYSINYFIDPLRTNVSLDVDRTRLTHMINYFKADMTDGKNIYKGHPFTPHQLRHLRVYNLHFNWGYDWDLIRVWLGWDNENMKEHYVYIRKQLKAEQQLSILEKYLDMHTHQKIDLSPYGLASLNK